MKKPFGAKAHCLIDYGFAAMQAFLPLVLGLSKKTTRRSQLMGAGVLAYSTLTRSPVALFPAIPFKAHKWIDISTLMLLLLTTTAKDVRNDKRALTFHLGLLAMGITAVSLTNWRRKDC